MCGLARILASANLARNSISGLLGGDSASCRAVKPCVTGQSVIVHDAGATVKLSVRKAPKTSKDLVVNLRGKRLPVESSTRLSGVSGGSAVRDLGTNCVRSLKGQPKSTCRWPAGLVSLKILIVEESCDSEASELKSGMRQSCVLIICGIPSLTLSAS